ncbi:aldo/keto reductase, partial [Bifidobacterium pseudocatenulatum]
TGYRRTMEVPAFVAPVSDSGESDKQGAGFGAQMSDSPESDTQGRDSEGCSRRPGEERQHLQAAGSQYGWMADSRPETMIRDAKESALHLGVDTLDLLYSHGSDPAVPYEDQCGALKQLLDEGVIKYAGISRVNNEQIDLARGIIGSGLVAVQNQFSPSHPDPEHTMEHCAELGLAFVCWSPLGGFLDTFDQSAYDPFRTVAAQRGCSYQRVVLAWELTRYERLFTIPSARNPQEINDSFAATQLQLTQEELAMLPC